MDNLPENETRGLQLLMTIAESVTAGLIETGHPADQARAAGLSAADQVRREYSGMQVYVPKGMALVLSERDWQLWEEYDGTNHLALAKKHDLTERQIYNIIARCRAEHDRKTQMRLFG